MRFSPVRVQPGHNASISKLAIVGDQWFVRSFNDTAHLDGLL